MGQPHRRVGGVDALAAVPARAIDVHAHVLIADLHVDFLGFGQHADGRGRRMDAALRLGFGYTLDAVAAALPLQARVCAATVNLEDHLFDAVEIGLAGVQDFHLPAHDLDVLLVHRHLVRLLQVRYLTDTPAAAL